jgi:hypothetical protein
VITILNVLSYFDNVLANDDVLKSLLSDYHGGPAISFKNAPEDMALPYLITSSASNVAEDNYITDRMLYNVDIYVDNNDIVTADAISKRVIELLANTRLPADVGLTVWKELEIILPEDDPSVIHYHLQFGLRHV